MDVDSSEGCKRTGKQVVVVLVGPPGSGKSTFCQHVMQSSRRPWTRICQDVINKGKAGTRAQCLQGAKAALEDGKSVFIDRCNLEKEQRSDFVNLGGPIVDVHAVVLDLPSSLCISRCVKRTDHEGNLQGGKAAAVVNRMLQKKELPTLNERYSRIVVCTKECDVDAAIEDYCKLGPFDTLPEGVFGVMKSNIKSQSGIMKFFKRAASSLDIPCALAAERSESDKGLNHSNLQKNLKEGLMHEQNVRTLAFPSISTGIFQFDVDKACDIIVETVHDYVNIHENIRFVLVDDKHDSRILSLVKSKSAQKKIDPEKFFTFVGDISCLLSSGNLQCNVIANAANWRLKSGGGGVNAAIFNAAGPYLETATKERATTLKPGNALVVPLPLESPLHSREGISHVIHVVGPNMNPQRPNCLDNDYLKGCKILKDAYLALFDGFLSIMEPGCSFSSNQNSSQVVEGTCDNIGNSLIAVEQNFEHNTAIGGNKKYKGCKEDDDVLETGSIDAAEKVVKHGSKIGRTKSKSWGSWTQSLFNIAMHPEKNKDVILETSDDVVVLYDAYPKAQKHLLVVSRREGLDSMAELHIEHLELLLTMQSCGIKWAEKILDENSSMAFRIGYHSEPSMRQLHLHVISQDFDSPHLKNKKHWNSFNTAFFRDSIEVIDELEKTGRPMINDSSSYLSTELRCHRCRSAHPNIPRLKAHIGSCRAPFPPSLLKKGILLRRDAFQP